MSEISIADIGDNIVSGKSSDDVAQAYMPVNYQIGSWDDNTIMFSVPPSKRAKDNNGDVITGLNNIDSQFSPPQTSLEMEKLLQRQQDYVPFKIRAKQGCATHPRSIAERERRTKINEKLRNLQELVPNMDKVKIHTLVFDERSPRRRKQELWFSYSMKKLWLHVQSNLYRDSVSLPPFRFV